MEKKNIITHKFAQGSPARAFGNTLKLSSAPDNGSVLISRPFCWQKWPKYMKMLIEHSIPQRAPAVGTRNTPISIFSFFFFMLEKWITPASAKVNWNKDWTIASSQIPGLRSLWKSGIRIKFSPSIAPSKEKALIASTTNKKKGANAV